MNDLNVTLEQLFAIIGRKTVENMLMAERIKALTEANAQLSQELTRLTKAPSDDSQPAS